ncbi:MAG: hypothetical protein ACK4GT_18955, partial [Pararhodobacter sp.]
LALPGLSITDVFRFPVLSALAGHIDAKLRPVTASAPVEDAPADSEAARGRLNAMSRRRAMRAERLSKLG